MLEFLKSVLANPSLKRAAVGGLTAAMIAGNKRLHLDMDTESILALVGLAVAFIGQSSWRQTKAAGVDAAAKVATAEDAAAVLGKS